MDMLEKVSAEFQCAALMATFFNRLDDRRSEDVANLMAPEGVWLRQGRELRGAAMVFEAMNQRSQTVNTRHLMTNQELTATGADAVEGRFVATIYAHDSGKPQAVGKLEGPRSIAVFEVKFCRTTDGWRIAHLSNRRVFKRE
jgi:hypothetical protein